MDRMQTSGIDGQAKSGVDSEKSFECPAIDHQVVSALVQDLSPDTYRSLLDTFSSDFIEVQTKLIAAMTAADVEELRRQLHAIRSISLPMGAVELPCLVRTIETHEDDEVLQATVRSLQEIARGFRRFQTAASALLR
jgi:HPt (histidine-containing phosphotransfer) domain-containing protein